MSGENSCFSRFLVKFVEVSAAGLATAISAYALAHLGWLLSSSPTPTSAPATAVQVSPTASEVAEGLRAQPSPPAAAAAVNKQSPAPQQDTDATVPQPALGTAHLSAMSMGSQVCLYLCLYLYGDTARAVATREQPVWRAWLDRLFPAPVGQPGA